MKGVLTQTFQTGEKIVYPKILSALSIQSLPRTECFYLESFDLSGLIIKAIYSDGTIKDVTNYITSSPAKGEILETLGNITVNISYTDTGKTVSTSFDINVSIKIVSWSSGSITDVTRMITAADKGLITLSDHWTIGEGRTIKVNAMSASTWTEKHASQNVTFVLMNVGGKELVNPTPSGRTTCSFIVGMRNGLSEPGGVYGYYSNEGGWELSHRRGWANSTFYNSIPSNIKSLFKLYKNKSGKGGGLDEISVTEDYFALPALTEVVGRTSNWTTPSEVSATYQFKYYQTEANRIKYDGNGGSTVVGYWTRSPYHHYEDNGALNGASKSWYNYITNGNNLGFSNSVASTDHYLSLFGVI